MHGSAAYHDRQPKGFLRDWGPSILFCGLGTYLFAGAGGVAGVMFFWGFLLLCFTALWLPTHILWRRTRPLVARFPPKARREFLATLPPRERRKLKRWLAKRRLTHRCTGPGRRV